MRIRELLQAISNEYDIRFSTSNNIYQVLTNIVIFMESKYNLQEEEIEKQLELILKAIKR